MPFGLLVSALWDRSLRRRSRFWPRLAALVVCMILPWMTGLLGPVADGGFVVLLWGGFGWAMMLAMLAPLLLFRGPGVDPGPPDDDGPGPSDDRPPPRRPTGGIPLPDAEQPATRVRGPHRPGGAAGRRRPVRERERRPLRQA
jgi:hypothetical protein